MLYALYSLKWKYLSTLENTRSYLYLVICMYLYRIPEGHSHTSLFGHTSPPQLWASHWISLGPLSRQSTILYDCFTACCCIQLFSTVNLNQLSSCNSVPGGRRSISKKGPQWRGTCRTSVAFVFLCSRISFNGSFTLTAYVNITTTECAEAMKWVLTAFQNKIVFFCLFWVERCLNVLLSVCQRSWRRYDVAGTWSLVYVF